jgi:hypothetical protein
MAGLQPMPQITIDSNLLKDWGKKWLGTLDSNGNENGKKPNCFDKKQGMDFGKIVLDPAVASALATMLGGVTVRKPSGSTALLPPESDCIEIGDTRIIGGIRPQNFDIAYRPDGLRIAYDSKTLNDFDSIKKNWQNMINDLATEATTVHTRFPYAIVAFLVAVPKPALDTSQEYDITRTLERLGGRKSVQNQNHLAEAVSFVVWDPSTGLIDTSVPNADSILRIEKYSNILYPLYLERYKGLPPHSRS